MEKTIIIEGNRTFLLAAFFIYSVISFLVRDVPIIWKWVIKKETEEDRGD